MVLRVLTCFVNAYTRCLRVVRPCFAFFGVIEGRCNGRDKLKAYIRQLVFD